MIKYYVLLGPPGAGKGTQAAMIADTCGIPHISTGNIFRENLQSNTELGKKAKQFMDKGELVPDDITIEMVKDRLLQADCSNGALLDGFPRTPNQAEALTEFLSSINAKVACVPFINVEVEELVERLSGRWTCKAEGHVFHIKYKPPKVEGICDYDGSPLYQRKDDKKETVEQRIRVYFKQTAPLIDFYTEEGLLVEVNGALSIEQVNEALMKIINC
ncbi:MAG: adenylate kinase [Anaerolineaceae bacterium]|nr:adenylate kinase [Anaerolineaceae bacterium]